jgi:hypothetical protein
MMRRAAVAGTVMAVGLCVMVPMVFATSVTEGGGGSKVWDGGWHDAGLIRLHITNFGRHGYENGCEWPAGSGQTYIFGAGIWVGCTAEGDTLVTVGYDPTNGSSEFVPGDLPNEPGYDDTTEHIYWSDDPDDLAEWPVTDGNGDPVIVSTLDSWCQFNDVDSTAHVAGDTRPIGVRVTQTGYSWNYPAYEDFAFLIYEVENTSGVDISQMYLGVACDADVGDYTNDLVGFEPTRNLGYAYTERPPGQDVAGYIGYDFLESPLDSTGQQLGLTAFKIFTNQAVPPDPGSDVERYLVLAGYNYQTGEYEPFDEIATATDIRFVQCTGPFNLAPGDTGRVVVAIIAGADTTDLFLNSDVAQIVYDNDFATHGVSVVAPNGGETLTGTADITWETVSGTGNPLTVDLFYSRDRGSSWIEIASGEPDDSLFSWNTAEAPDGTWNMVRVTVTDGILVGEDTSDSLFTIDNPGNGVPDVVLISPNVGQIEGTQAIVWEAADADGDSLFIDLYYGYPDTQWTAMATGLPNTGTYDWSSYEAINGTYYLKVVASDAEASSSDLSDYMVTIYNYHDLYSYASHTHGGCNTVTLLPYVHIAEQVVDHDYRVEFNLIREGNLYEPVYSYDLVDETTGELLLDDQELSTKQDGAFYTDWSPLFHGISLKIDSQVDQTTFHYVDFEKTENASGCDAALSINFSVSTYGWAFRGADFELRWQAAGGDTLTLEVWDLTNDVAVPVGAELADNWAFARTATDLSPVYRPGTDIMIWVCGGFFVFDLGYAMTIPPAPGDIWTITASGDHVPCDGNVYNFGPGTGAEDPGSAVGLPRVHHLGQSIPNPSAGAATIRYELPRAAWVTLTIYDLRGREVRRLLDAPQAAGRHAAQWDCTDERGSAAAPGMYVYRLTAGDFSGARRMAIVR